MPQPTNNPFRHITLTTQHNALLWMKGNAELNRNASDGLLFTCSVCTHYKAYVCSDFNKPDLQKQYTVTPL